MPATLEVVGRGPITTYDSASKEESNVLSRLAHSPAGSASCSPTDDLRGRYGNDPAPVIHDIPGSLIVGICVAAEEAELEGEGALQRLLLKSRRVRRVGEQASSV